jgi:hypothetical protein
MTHQHNKYMAMENESEEMLRENEINFVQAYQSTVGPFKFMTEEAKE